ncbi:hypothetical protein AB0F17_62195 [Nonomuraea sp. NPDC026600]|uniref:hypothetical protein n=1 Tax=Nonomuraea sp. NPDC026600 TaxID=3155363 RepID=UPI0033F8AB96
MTLKAGTRGDVRAIEDRADSGLKVVQLIRMGSKIGQERFLHFLHRNRHGRPLL